MSGRRHVATIDDIAFDLLPALLETSQGGILPVPPAHNRVFHIYFQTPKTIRDNAAVSSVVGWATLLVTSPISETPRRLIGRPVFTRQGRRLGR